MHSHMILSGLFKDYCVYLGDKLLSICRNRKPNTFIFNSMLCNTMQKHSNTAENKHLISLFVEICCVPQPLAFAMILHYSMFVFVSVCFGLSSCFTYPIPFCLSFQLFYHTFYSSPVTFYSTRHYNSQANNSSKKLDKRINFGLGLRMVNIAKIQQ